MPRTGTDVFPDGSYCSLWQADAIHGQLPVGATVPVFYNPADPRECYLKPVGTSRLAGGAIGLAVSGVALICLGAYFLTGDLASMECLREWLAQPVGDVFESLEAARGCLSTPER
jgi:hypothetical protein